MTVPTRPSRLARLLDGGGSTGLFVIGMLFDLLCVMNVPGAAVFADGRDPSAEVTTVGVLLVLLAAACWATVFVRRRHPWAVAVAGGLLLVLGVSYALMLVGAYSLIARRPDRAVAVYASAVIAVLLFVTREVLTDWGYGLAWLLDKDPSPDEPVWSITALVIAVMSLGLLAALVIARRAQNEASVSRVRAEQQHDRAAALDEQVARQAERERIARDLHDGLGHRLSAMALAAGAFESQAAAGTADPALAGWASALRQQAHAALEDVRGVVGGLRSDSGDAASPSPAPSLRLVGGLLADLRAAGHRIDAYVVIEGLEQASAPHDAAAFRVVQESLTNALKHGDGALISVLVDAAPDRGIRIRVDNPVGSPSAGLPGGGHGIVGMRERVASVGGTAWIGAHEGRFIVDATIPWG